MTPRRPPHRRGTVLAAAMMLLVLLGTVVVAAVAAAGDDANAAALRIESLRALYAAESGIVAGLKQQRIDNTNPLTGTFTLPDGETYEIIRAFDPAPNPPGRLEVRGTTGRGVRLGSARDE